MTTVHDHERLLAAIVSVVQARGRLDALDDTERRAAILAAAALGARRVDLAQLASYLHTHHGEEAVTRLITRLELPARIDVPAELDIDVPPASTPRPRSTPPELRADGAALRRAKPPGAGAEGAMSSVRTQRRSAGRSRPERERREP
ncbi:MAG TPA: hypothetical protein VIB48_25045 [Acidimicrobiia bacterium]